MRLRRFLFSVARSSLGGMIVGWVFAYMSFLIPVERLRDTNLLLAFHHPRPSYPVHILIVPKKRIGTMLELTSADADFLIAVFDVVRSLVAELGLDKRGYRLVTNGGSYQDVPQLHFHLISEERS